MGTVRMDIHRDIIYAPIHSHFWRFGDVSTVPTKIHTEIETQYTIPIHSQFWSPMDVETLPTNIHTEIET